MTLFTIYSIKMGILAKHSSALKVSVVPALASEAKSITNLINDECKRSGAVLHVSENDVKSWIDNGLCFVAKNEKGQIIGHQAASKWPESGWVELRAAVVLQEYRGNGLNTKLKDAIIDAINTTYPEATIVSLKNGESRGHNELAQRGFEKIDSSAIPPAILKELLKIGPLGETYEIYIYPPLSEIKKALRPA